MVFATVCALSGCKPPSTSSSSETPAPDSEPIAHVESATPGGASPPSTSRPSVSAIPPQRPAKPRLVPPAEIWKEFSGDKAFAEARGQVEIGPRPSGSPEIETARRLIEGSLHHSGWDVERQVFTDETPHGPVEFVNLIARFSASGKSPAAANPQQAIVCSHYDTKIFSNIRFVGASDGASSTGALLELARVLAMDPALAEKLELVFFDGEEAVVQFTAPDEPHQDGLYGSRHYAKELMDSGRARQFRFGILWDMIGDRNLTITLPPDSPVELMREILSAADAMHLRQHFSILDRTILDDHYPLNHAAHIPTIDLIDFDYPAWHTADDNLEHIGAESLQKVGAVTLYHLRKALGK